MKLVLDEKVGSDDNCIQHYYFKIGKFHIKRRLINLNKFGIFVRRFSKWK